MGRNFELLTLLRSTSPMPTKMPNTLPSEKTLMAIRWCLNFDPWLAVSSTPRQKATTILWEMTAVKRIMTFGVVSWMPIAKPSRSEWTESAVSIPMMPARVCLHGSWWLVWQIRALMLASSWSCWCWCSAQEDVTPFSMILSEELFSSVLVPYDVWPWCWACKIGWDSSCGCSTWIASPQQKCRSSSIR